MIYFFYGEDLFEIARERDSFLNNFKKKFGENSITKITNDTENFSIKISEIFNINLLFQKRLFILENPEKNIENWRIIGENLSRLNKAENDILIISENPDKRTKTYKNLLTNCDKNAREFKKKSPRAVIISAGKIARELGFSADQKSIEKLTSFCAFDEWRIYSELKKLREISDKLDEKIIKKFIAPDPITNVFEIFQFALTGEKLRAKNELEKIHLRGEEPIKFFGLLVSQVFALAAASEENPKFSEYKIAPFQLHKAGELWRRILQKNPKINKRAFVAKLARKLAEMDIKIKRTDQNQIWIYIEIFLGEI